ncbi:hypothetical protein SeLEV6574_g06355 [Synchytrium endobioticum]|uniref:Carboxylesterase type B domain-containing protein n=1 Tax=Synchytrium endobioticum TaxID=286115 RepID=A0A507CP43_9FUNG|nr:hypothetical protein SeLEV6574_g06355 [Synchytrium endobioticum]
MPLPLPLPLLAVLVALFSIREALASGGHASAPGPASADTATAVVLDYGTVVGRSTADRSVKLWLGIPYASPPVGPLRFKPPTSPQDLGPNFQATSYGNWCPQDPNVALVNQATGTQSEDCLTLNIFAPASANSSSNLPVMVFIHGGSYTSGSGALGVYNASNLVMTTPTPVVIVTFNYRLGALGFLAGQELLDEGSTNAAMLDQVAVFNWVKKYIPAFGGNSSSITAFGESAGAQSIGAHLVAYGGNQTLFNRAILQSGSTMSGPLPAANSNSTQSAFNAIATYVNCSTFSGPAKLSCMRNRIGIFTPVVDGRYMLTKPTVALTQTLFSRIPVIIGINTNEGTIFIPSLVDSAQALYNATFALQTFVSAFAANMPAGSSDQVLSLYPLTSYNNSAVAAAAEIFADLAFTCPMLSLSKTMSAAGAPVYRYRFNQLLQLASSEWARNGVFHSSELPFVFGNSIVPSEEALSQTMIGFWTRFAASGNPNGGNATWPVYSPGGPAIVLQSSTLPALTTESDPNKDAQCAFWNSQATQTLVDH